MSVRPNILGVIPARGQSKRLPGKNAKMFAGMPLIAWTIQAAKQSQHLSRVIFSSEDEALIDIAKQYECEVPFVRPYNLSLDDTPGIAPVLHALDHCPGFDYVVLLQVTSPLRTAQDIDACIEACLQCGAPACVSLSVSSHETCKNKQWLYRLGPEHQLYPMSEPRYHGPLYQLNGAIYVAKVPWLCRTRQFITAETRGFVMPIERSIDIDTINDFQQAERTLG